jgi:hypothetical protein
MSLSSSARRSGIEIDVRGIVDPEIDTGIPGGRELLALGREAVRPTPTAAAAAATIAVAGVIGPAAALAAVEQTGAFQMTNRAVEATGLPVLARQRERMMPELELLGALGFSGSSHTIARPPSRKETLLHRIERRLRS